MKHKPPNKVPTDAPTTLTHSPFAKLTDLAPATAPTPPKPPPPASTADRALPVPARAVVRYERTGRGGREVTLIKQLALRPRDLEAYLKALKKGLGCGGVLEDSALVLQGDQRDRVIAWLSARGVAKVIRGS